MPKRESSALQLVYSRIHAAWRFASARDIFMTW